MTAISVSAVNKSYGDTKVLDQVTFDVQEAEFVTLLGPSGCGKTTTLRCIAGLAFPDTGSITIAGRRAFSSSERISLKPEQRHLGMVFQSYAIWPHMTVFENVAYGLRAKRCRQPELAEKVERALETVGLPGYAQRYATQLSGGQQQRVALARSLVVEPEVLLLDEPLSNLDAKLREHMRIEMKELQRRLGLTAVYVTHDQSEALALSDKIIVMERGRIVQQGTSEEIYFDPQSRFVLDFIGQANLITGSLSGFDGASGHATVTTADGVAFQGEVPLSVRNKVKDGADAAVAFRPEDLRVSANPISDSGRAFAGRVVSQLFLGASRELQIEVGQSRIRAQVSSEERVCDGQEVWLTVEPCKARVLP